jgi:hypothetical protein
VPVGTYLYGRRIYETMRYWETAHTVADQPPVALDFARIWQAADKIVYTTTLQTPYTARTCIERDFDPVQVRKLKETAGHVEIPSGYRGNSGLRGNLGGPQTPGCSAKPGSSAEKPP